MSPEPLTIQVDSSELLVVPAIHFNHVFALEVNRICSDSQWRPEAIAVEVGPQAANEVGVWLRELGVGPKARRKLPVMLGLTRRNRTIRSSLRGKAFRLQQETGRDLSDLPPEVLYRELGYAGRAILYLCPTDSIIEAIRCSVELDLPVYGVDIEEPANGNYPSALIQDPLGAEGDLTAYILENVGYAAHSGDHEVDGRREIAMAARLKALLVQYRRVLFTCGIGHWLRIKKLIEDSSILPAMLPQVSAEGNGYRRVVVHPLIAIRHMDLFPAVVKSYERTRNYPSIEQSHGKPRSGPDPRRLLTNRLKKTYASYFLDENTRRVRAKQSRDLQSLQVFHGYLMDLSLFNHRIVPDMFTTVKAAGQVMSDQFARTLAETFMDFPWASPDDFPECSLIAPGLNPPGSVMFLKKGSGEGDTFYIQSMQGNRGDGVKVSIPYQWEKENSIEVLSAYNHVLHTWPPWDCLISSMSMGAIGRVRTQEPIRTVQLFAGSLQEGIDIKATVRAHSRGKKDIFVRDSRTKKTGRLKQWRNGFPVVWILDPGDHPEADWTALYEECHWMVDYVKDRDQLDSVRQRLGDKMISIIGYAESDIETKVSDSSSEVRSDRYYGILLYQPISWTAKQFAHWAESTRYKRNPYCYSSRLGERVSSYLTKLFREEHGVKVGEHHWSTSLILMAIPFAQDTVTVVAPDGHEIEPVVFHMARTYGVRVVTIALSLFSQQEIERLSISHMVPAVVNKPRCTFSESIEKAIGEPQDGNLDLVPEPLLEFGDFFRKGR